MCFQDIIKQAWMYGVDGFKMMHFYTSFDSGCNCKWCFNRLQDSLKEKVSSCQDIADFNGSRLEDQEASAGSNSQMSGHFKGAEAPGRHADIAGCSQSKSQKRKPRKARVLGVIAQQPEE